MIITNEICRVARGYAFSSTQFFINGKPYNKQQFMKKYKNYYYLLCNKMTNDKNIYFMVKSKCTVKKSIKEIPLMKWFDIYIEKHICRESKHGSKLIECLKFEV